MSSSSSPRPADISDQSLISAPHPPSDSAPPPSSSPSPTTVPPRTYSSQSTINIRPPPAYAPNSSVPKFIRFLALIVFLGGSLTAGTAWFYKSIVYPRLVLALKAKRELFGFHKSRYEVLFEGLKKFLGSESVKRLGGCEAVEFRRKQREEEEKELKEGQEEEEETCTEKETVQSEKAPLLSSQEDDSTNSIPSLPPPPQLLLPLQSSLSSLHSTLSTSSSLTSNSKSNPSNLVQPQGQLMRSFVTFNEYLESELSSVNAANRTFSGYGSTGGSVSGERKVLSEATIGFKSEIRSIKGALLNRRNFVRPEIGVTA